MRAWVEEACTLDSDAWTSRQPSVPGLLMTTLVGRVQTLSAREFYNRIEQIAGIVATIRQGVRGLRGVAVKGADAKLKLHPKV